MSREYDEKLYNDTFDEIQPTKNLCEKIKKRKFSKSKKYMSHRAAAAIIIFLLCSTTTAFAMTNQFSFLKLFSNEDESGYQLQVKVNKIDHNDFDGEIIEVKDIILNQIENYDPYMSSYPFGYTKNFGTIGDSMEYLGIDISYFTIEEDAPATMNIMCNSSGDIVQILIMTDYTIYGNNVQVWYYIFSDLQENPYYEIMNGIAEGELMEEGLVTFSAEEESIVFGSVAAEEINYQIETVSLSDGQQIPLVLSGKNANNIETAESYFSQSDIVYSIHVAADADKEVTARDTLLEILQR